MNYDQMTDDEFDSILNRLIDDEYSKSPSSILQIPGIYEILAEHFNNEVLDVWAANRPEEEDDE